jgi:hypothetical protein
MTFAMERLNDPNSGEVVMFACERRGWWLALDAAFRRI